MSFDHVFLYAYRRGDCNDDDSVNAADMSALVSEIFDDDGAFPQATLGGTFAGNPGCNANRDAVVDAGDLSCMARPLLDGMTACP